MLLAGQLATSADRSVAPAEQRDLAAVLSDCSKAASTHAAVLEEIRTQLHNHVWVRIKPTACAACLPAIALFGSLQSTDRHARQPSIMFAPVHLAAQIRHAHAGTRVHRPLACVHQSSILQPRHCHARAASTPAARLAAACARAEAFERGGNDSAPASSCSCAVWWRIWGWLDHVGAGVCQSD